MLRSLAAWSARACALLGLGLVCCVSSGCGSQRLETAAEPAAASGDGGTGGAVPVAGAASGGDAATGAAGGGGAPEPLEIEELVGPADFASSSTVGPVSASRIQVDGQPFSDAWRATMAEPPSSPWVAQLVVPLNRSVAAGQLLRVSFWLNCETPGDTGDCYTEYIFERASDPWEKSVTFVAHAGAGWSQKAEYFSVVNAYDEGQAQMVFRLGYASQVIQIGGLVVQRIGSAP